MELHAADAGLVGGHCIGVDLYYLLHQSERAGFIPDIIRKAREINDAMARHMAQRLIRHMLPSRCRFRMRACW